jgi:tetratricopeptide (TPR) repeat protein
MHEFWDFVVTNKEMLGWIGGGITAIATAGWAVVVRFFPTKEDKSKGATSTSVTQSGTGIASGRDTVVSGSFNIGLDEKKVGDQIADAQKPLTDQLERLAAQISRDKGVPIAPLRTILIKLGEGGVPEEAIPQRLDAKADELLRLRDEISQLRLGPVELASFAQRAQTLIDRGDLDAARNALAEGRAAAHQLREQSSRYEADFLAREAEIDGLQLAYRAAAAKYSEAAALVAGFDPEKRWQLMNNHASELYRQGDEFGDNDALLQAIAALRGVLTENTRERVPLDWAMTQNNLGNALQKLGEREIGTARLEEAVAAYRAALEEYTRERVPLDWAMTQNNLGNALSSLGQQESGTARLEEAVAAYRAALEEYTRERVPFDWAMTQNNLGNALRLIGERKSGTTHLEEAATAFRAALAEFNREWVPLRWAGTQYNLGIALAILSERKSDTVLLKEAVEAFRATLAERTRERVPLQWAETQRSLGNALRILGQRETGAACFLEAVAAYHSALTEFTLERVPVDWAMTQHNLGNALLNLGERRGSDTALLQEAAVACRASLLVDSYFSDRTRAVLAHLEAFLAQRGAL